MATAVKNKVKPTLLIDASIYIFQYYFSMPDHWTSDSGYPSSAVYGYTTFLLRLLEDQQPERLAACFDASLGSCFRNKIYPNYKISRPPADDALKFQIDACREVTELLGIATLASTEFEADDLIGALCKKLRKNAEPLAILTRDKDLGQLIRREHDFLWDYAKNERYYAPHIKEKFGVTPDQLHDYLALVGDAIDDIPGVPGLGPKTAAALLQRYPCVKSIFAALDELHLLPIRGAQQLKAKLIAHKAQIAMAQQLTKIAEHATPCLTAKALRWHCDRIDRELLQDFCRRMGFPRLFSRVETVFGC